MRRALPIFLSLAGLLTIAGCGGTEEATPVACLAGPGAYVAALDGAPGAVRLGGEAPISDCLAPNQEGGALATVGASMLSAAVKLNAAARADPGGAAPLRLGYLLGAAARGAEQTAGVHAELARRLRAAALYSPNSRPLPAAFLDAYRQGFEAGRSNG